MRHLFLKIRLNIHYGQTNVFTKLFCLLLLSLFAMGVGAQTQGVPYDPCKPVSCTVNSDDCNDLQFYHVCDQFPCSTGYCLTDPADNAGIPSGGGVSGKTYDITGVYKITTSAQFSNCYFKMQPGSSIVIEPAAANVYVSFSHCFFSGCSEMWKGISTSNPHAYSSFRLDFAFENKVEDAYIALNLYEGQNNQYLIYGNQFSNNHIGIGNVLQNNSFLNAAIVRNSFSGNTLISNSSISEPMPDYPSPYAGIKVDRAIVNIGQLPNIPNIFSCLQYGIISNTAVTTAYSNIFKSICNYGIWATGGTITTYGSSFINGGRTCIYAQSANVYSTSDNFQGRSINGVYSTNNTHAEYVQVIGGIFTMDAATWVAGVDVQRSQANTDVHDLISGNTFNISNGSGVRAIHYWDLVNALDEALISANTINILSGTPVSANGIEVYLGNSNNVHLLNNNINYNVTDPHSNFGILIRNTLGLNVNSTGHEARHNSVTGISNTSLQCGFHTVGVSDLRLCDNTVDFSIRGFHFVDENDVFFRQNHIHHHDYGVLIEDLTAFPTYSAYIGLQTGRGNDWSGANNQSDCGVFAAQCKNCGDPLTSKFTIFEGSTLPFDPQAEVDPPVSQKQWFLFNQNTPQDYCVSTPIASGPTRSLTSAQRSIIQSTSVHTGVELWDLKQSSYSALLFNPALRPTGSTEATFFNGLSSSIFDSFGQVQQYIASGLNISSTDEQTLANAAATIKQSIGSIGSLDAAIDFSNPQNLTSSFFSSRYSLSQTVASNNSIIQSIKGALDTQLATAVQSALSLNDNLSTGSAVESARKALNHLLLNHLINTTLTQTTYQQIISLAQQDPSTAGASATDAALFVSPCDQYLFPTTDGPVTERSAKEQSQVLNTASSNGDFKVMPNPSMGLFYITTNAAFTGSIKIYDMTGRAVYSNDVIEGTAFEVNLAQLTTGIYRLALVNTKGVVLQTSKIVLSH